MRIARYAFSLQLNKSSERYYEITTGDKFQDNHRILKNFGRLISTVRITDSRVEGVQGSTWKVTFASDWLQRFCAGTLETLQIVGRKEIIALPPSAVALMSTSKMIDIRALIHPENLRIALSNCKELVELYLHNCVRYDFSSGLWNNRFPHLKKLECGFLDSNLDLNQIELFFQNHTKLTTLRLLVSQLYYGHYHDDDGDYEDRIDVSFLKNLRDLEELELQLDFSIVEGIDALSHLQNLQTFILWALDVETYTAILDSVAEVDSLVTLTFIIYRDWFRDISDVGRVLQSIKRLKNLSKLSVVVHKLDFVSLQPKKIVDVVRKLTKIKVLDLDCEFKSKLDELPFKDLAKVCSSQKRKVTLCVNAERWWTMNIDDSLKISIKSMNSLKLMCSLRKLIGFLINTYKCTKDVTRMSYRKFNLLCETTLFGILKLLEVKV